jgi:hypothetical protein
MTTLTFPETLRSEENINKPYVRISIPHDPANVIKTDIQSVCLFMPEGVGTEDSATWEGVDLGVNRAIKSFINQSKDAPVTAGDLQVAGIALIGMIPGLGTVGGTEALGMASKAAFNQQTALTFKGVALRSFSLNYTFAASSPTESATMQTIENFFRKFLYPEAIGAWSLKFPPAFRVDFMKGSSRNPYMPVYYDSYLKSVSVQMNPSGRAFFSNGAPTSMQLDLSFSESKQLTRNNLYGAHLRPNMTSDGMRPIYPDAPPLDKDLTKKGEAILGKLTS